MTDFSVKKKAYAKINLTLEILGTKRNDGYHDISSVMHKIPLCDELIFSINKNAAKNGVKLQAAGNEIPCDIKDNLAYRAAEKYLEKYTENSGKTAEISIKLQKIIPSGAGLAGGSADAACVLRALFEELGNISEKELFSIALSLGSDVPFCLSEHTCALCTGRGEIMTILPPLSGVYLSVIFPSEPLITAGIYAEYDRAYGEDYGKEKSEKFAYALSENRDKEEILSYMTNDFQTLCEKKCESVKKALEMLAKDGAKALMTGSGSAVYGIFTDREKFEKSKGKTYENGWKRFDYAL
ncbi:MAG: 4-(cytidine 5'-diphospho)-2-C-methyl-D-erythritol kinase [Clostridia bacterium]|nr:4-(cytidine 5'-diphospho)-2-C-methyl-D-erythritol kinase [Clostridia bacterium]